MRTDGGRGVQAAVLKGRIGEIVRRRRAELQMPLRELRDRIGARPALAALSRFERGDNNMRLDVLADWCRALDTDLVAVLRESLESAPPSAVGAATAATPERAPGQRPSGPTGLPEIMVNIAHLVERDEPRLQAIRGMLMFHARSRADANHDFLIDGNLLQVLAMSANLDTFECWQLLARSIVHMAPPASVTAS